jgi:membrane protease YdiL (CAAX protease family)
MENRAPVLNGPSTAEQQRGEMPALLFAMLFPTLAAWLYFMVFTDRQTLPAVYTISKVVQFSFPLAWTLALRRGRLPRLTLAPRALLEGVGTGLVMVILLFLAYVALMGQGALVEEARPRILARVQAIGAGTPVRFLGLALFLSVLHSLLEEYYWRWFVFGRLQERLRMVTAVVLSSLAFMLHHVVILHAFLGPRFWPATMAFSLAVGGGGAAWAAVYRRCRLLAAPWISHMLVDLAILAIDYDLIRGLL